MVQQAGCCCLFTPCTSVETFIGFGNRKVLNYKALVQIMQKAIKICL